ncbi:MAG TPA: M23 family metallopeptidase [Candidatus Angelobacter sp.]|nr:M23 family metallopeptidase [Candidatus Angelobacter sp.]
MRGRVGILRRQFVDVLDRAFVPRELFLRADGRVRYVRVSRRQQMAAAAVVTGFAGWTLASTAGLAVSAFLLSQQSTQRHEAEVAYAELRAQVAATRGRFAEMAAALSSQQRFLLGLVKSPSNDTAAPAPGAIESAAAVAVADPVQQTLSETAANLAAITSNNRALGQQLATIESHVSALDEARARAAAARDRYAAALQATAAQLAMQHQQVASLNDAATVLRTEVATLDGSRQRTAAARDYYADAWHQTEAELAAQRAGSSSLADQVAALRAQIDRMNLAAADDAGARRTLDQRIAELSANLAAATGENGQLTQAVRGMQRTVALIADDRSALRAARNGLSAQVAFLEGRMSSMQQTQQTIMQNLTDRAHMTVAQIEKTIIMTGLDVDGLLDAAALKTTGEGGPFIPVARSLRSTEERTMLASIQKLDGEVGRWEHLQLILRNLPLAAPLDNYQLMSGFGERLDPFTGQRAMHAGLDLKNDLGTPVLATAPGTVIYADWMRDYGRVVEIDHGLGIHTRYAHLKAITVKVGQKVEFRQEVGKLGNSGRSTGPHLHYEVQVNGKPQDPMNFMEAGKYVFKG